MRFSTFFPLNIRWIIHVNSCWESLFAALLHFGMICSEDELHMCRLKMNRFPEAVKTPTLYLWLVSKGFKWNVHWEKTNTHRLLWLTDFSITGGFQVHFVRSTFFPRVHTEVNAEIRGRLSTVEIVFVWGPPLIFSTCWTADFPYCTTSSKMFIQPFKLLYRP